MLDIKYIREHSDEVVNSLDRRGLKIDINEVLSLDLTHREILTQMQKLRASLKQASSPDEATRQKLVADKQELEKLTTKLSENEQKLNNLLVLLPNRIADNTPDGGEQNNRLERQVGELPQLDNALDHLAIGEKYNLFNFEAGAKVAGSKFYFLQSRAVRLWRAILALTTDIIEAEQYEVMMVPHLVNEKIAAGTGYLPKDDSSQNYYDQDQKLVMIATSEIPLTGYWADSVVDVSTPIKASGLSTCYRLEAGSYGKYAKGLYRVHQFEKLELYVVCTSNDSDLALQNIIKLQEKITASLQIPYRLMRSAVGDLSAAAYEKYDIEYYSPVDGQYRELTSCSNCTDFQSRRLNIRYRADDGKLVFAHTLNGTATTSTRHIIALLENHQDNQGKVKIPTQLVKYYGSEYL